MEFINFKNKNMKNVTVDLSSGVSQFGNSIGKVIVMANSEQEACSIAEDWAANEEENGQQGLGIITDSYFQEDGKYYFAIVS